MQITMTNRRQLFFRCLVLGTLGYCGVYLLAKGPTVIVKSWQMAIIRLNRHHVTGLDKPISAAIDLSVDNTNLQLLRNNDVTVAVFNCNPYWLTHLGLDRRPNRYSCPDSKRLLTVKSAYRDVDALRDADVVIFAAWLANKTLWDEVVEKRKSNQIWVYSTAESAYSSPQIRDDRGRPIGFGKFRFNISFGYHSFSNVMAPFGEYRPTRRRTKMKPTKSVNYFKEKVQSVSWVSSHCGGQFWNRTGFAQSLAKLIPVDTYGACGEKKLPRGPAMIETLSKYKFHLALENSCCSEYITEKLWHPLAEYYSVPVVLGPSRVDYERVAPPNSFVFADDFKSLGDLARYLRRVSRSPTLYNKFHEWRRHGDVTVYGSGKVYPFTSKESACALLEFLEKTVPGGAVEDDTRKTSMTFDPFSSQWLGSCRACGDNEWLTNFNTNTDAFNPTLRGKNHNS